MKKQGLIHGICEQVVAANCRHVWADPTDAVLFSRTTHRHRAAAGDHASAILLWLCRRRDRLASGVSDHVDGPRPIPSAAAGLRAGEIGLWNRRHRVIWP